MASTIDFNVSTNAVTVLNQTATAADNTAKGFTSAKAELRALQQQLLTMDQSSAEFKKASARAAELKDNISDLSAEINANAGNAFESLSNNVGLFGSRLMSLDLKGAGQALSAMGGAVGRIDFKTLKDEIGGLVKGFGNLAKAILSNPILLLAGAVALVVANFDKLVKFFPAIEKGLTGINQQERDLLDLQTKRAEQAKKNYENISATENTLKLQGKTEREIRDMKISAIKAAIEEAKVRLQTQRQQEKAQIDMAVRNRDILAGVIKFVMAPLNSILEAIDGAANLLGMESNLSKDLSKWTAELLIDPEQQQADLQKSFQEQEDNIRAMQNSLDGFVIEQKNSDKKVAEDKKETVKKDNKDIKKIQDDANKTELEDIEKQNQAKIAAEDAKYKALQALQESALEKEVTAAVAASEELYALAGEDAAAEALIAENLEKEISAITKKYADEEKAAKEKKNEENAILAAKELEDAKKLEEEKAALRIANIKSNFEMADIALSALMDLNNAAAKGDEASQRKTFERNKLMQKAQATIAMASGIVQQLAVPQDQLTGSNFVKAAALAAAGIANIVKINQTQFGGAGGGGGGGVNAPSGGGGTTAPSPANFAFLGIQPNQQQPPLQAYVVSTQVSSNLEAQQLIQNQSRLGG